MTKTRFCFILALVLAPCHPSFAAPPTPTDKRLVLELVAKEPEIVTPTGIAVDEQGRVWAIENNTHQRPENYKGFASDRVRILEDFGPDGMARKISTFAEGFKNSMGLALGDNGAVYLVTRSGIHLLRDTKKIGKADVNKAIVKLESTADYPHNGLSGFAFDGLGDLYFGLGENLGADYKLVGSDGTTLSGGGEGGSIYRCRPDGSKLVRVATGFWNPFHQTFDAFGRHFAVDNDPDSRGPCRLLHIVKGGDYGYRFRNGRKGLHPFTAWNGELPGTLPYVAGTGEAPCGILSYESTGMPEEYVGNLLCTSWGDHVVERFNLSPSGASYKSKAEILVRGGEDFRPVGIAVGPDGVIYLSDWVDKSYPVHGKGRIWRLRWKDAPKEDGLRVSKVSGLDSAKLLALMHHGRQEIRARAGDALAGKGKDGIASLLNVLRKDDSVRAQLQALWSATKMDPKNSVEMLFLALKDKTPIVRAEGIHLLVPLLPQDPAQREESQFVKILTGDSSPYVRFQAVFALTTKDSLKAVVPLLTDKDPFLAGAALEVLGRPGHTDFLLPFAKSSDEKLRLGVLMALRRAGEAQGRGQIPKFLDDLDPEVRRAAIQWVGEDRLKEFADLLKASASHPPVTRDLFEALLASQAFLAGEKRAPSDEIAGEEYIATILKDPDQPTAFHILAVRMLRPDHPALDVARLKGFLHDKDKDLRREALRTLVMRADRDSQEVLRSLAKDTEADSHFRADAVMGLAHSAVQEPDAQSVLVDLLEDAKFQRDALRSLRAVGRVETGEKNLLAWWDKLPDEKGKPTAERRELAEQVVLALGDSKDRETAKRVEIIRKVAGERPRNEKEWFEALKAKGEPAAGERVFFHANGPRCYTCHRVDGRGSAIGPDLSTIGRTLNRDKLIESILTPSKEIAPQFVSWLITTRDGKTRTGVIVEEGPNSTYTVADAQGKLEVINRLDIEDRQALKTSIMPDKLPDLMTRQEFLDLLAYLENRR